MVSRMEGNNKVKAEKIRKMRAFAIISKGDMPKVKGKDIWVIPSQSNPDKTYTVTHNGKWSCDCPDHMETGYLCKHIQSIKIWQTFETNQDEDPFLFSIASFQVEFRLFQS